MKKTSKEAEGRFDKFALYKRSRSARRKSKVESKLSFEVSEFCLVFYGINI